MLTQQIGAYYQNLKFGDKGRFRAYLSLHLGGFPHSWQQKMLLWSSTIAHRPAIRVIMREITFVHIICTHLYTHPLEKAYKFCIHFRSFVHIK